MDGARCIAAKALTQMLFVATENGGQPHDRPRSKSNPQQLRRTREHGWILTKKWIEENKERVESRREEEYERLDRILREPVTVLEKENT
jgi:hypothetical protein